MKQFALLLTLLAACQAPSLDRRSETGQITGDDWAKAPYTSSNVTQNSVDEQAILTVGVSIRGNAQDKETIASDMQLYLEGELADLKRFPLIPLALGATASSSAQSLDSYGQIALPSGKQVTPAKAYTIEFAAEPLEKIYTPENYYPLKSVAGEIRECWFEGPITVQEVSRNGPRRNVFTVRNFRSRSSFTFRRTSLRGGGAWSEESKRLGWREAMNSVLLLISKEVYSKLGVEALVTSGKMSGDTLMLASALGDDQGVVQGQPIFILWKDGALETFIAKAVVNSANRDGSTVRVVGWNSGDQDADSMRRDPINYLNSNKGRIIARTEGLRAPQEWEERNRMFEDVQAKFDQDYSWLKEIPSASRAEVEKLLRTR